MAEAKYLLATFNFESREAPRDVLVDIFDKALDWVSYAPNCYILYTTTDKTDWFNRLRKRLNEDDSIFIIEFDPSIREGFLPRRVWNWLKKER